MQKFNFFNEIMKRSTSMMGLIDTVYVIILLHLLAVLDVGMS